MGSEKFGKFENLTEMDLGLEMIKLAMGYLFHF